MNKYLSMLFILLLVVSTTSCDKDFEEINRNIDDPIAIPSSKIIGQTVRDIGDALYSTFNGSSMGENWVQHNALCQYNSEDLYDPRPTSMDGLWNTFFLAASDANQMYLLAEGEGNTTNQGIALVLKNYAFTLLTDYYGDIPYSEALQGASDGVFAPSYDSQSAVYAGIVAELDTAMDLLASGVGTTDPNMDNLYQGDASKWSKFAASLKFRSLMRISGTSAANGAALQALVDAGGMFTSNDNEAKLVYLSASPDANPQFESIVAGGRGEHRMSATLIDFLANDGDPRLAVYAEPAEESGEYRGKPNGFQESPLPGYSFPQVSGIGAKYLEATAPGYFMSYTQLLLLHAEAAHRGLISGGDAAAQTYYEAALSNSFAENGVDGSSMISGALAYDAGNAMQQIGEQMWVALFGQGLEAWTEYRRSGYPGLIAVPEGFLSEIPSRLKYNTDDVSVNATNYSAAVSTQGPDLLTTKIWWNK